MTSIPKLKGEFLTDNLHRVLYATDASIYRQLPDAVAIPRDEEDLVQIIQFARQHDLPLIPRAAGTSLAGQCVGKGIVVDTSRYFTKILELNVEERWVRLQPGIIRDELNRYLAPHGLFFGPNTSTANRCMLGGMVGNNSCGSTSIKYGVTRDHVLRIGGILSDGSRISFGPLDDAAFRQKLTLPNREGDIYRFLNNRLSDPAVQHRIRTHYPKASIHRRNTGYALDVLLQMHPFSPDGPPFNLASLLCGSEGTLAFTTEITLSLDSLPPDHEVLICGHFESITASMEAVLTAMKHQPYACELMDRLVLDCTRGSKSYEHHRFFLEGDPAAVLMVEVCGETEAEAEQKADALIASWKKREQGYAYPKVKGKQSRLVWDLRKAGLGLLSNVPGDAKPVACIEDTAVALEDLPAYIAEFEQLMQHFGQQAVYYAHAGAGELHLRPLLNLKVQRDRQLLGDITRATAELVKKYQGSFSGEHGDGRVRASFIPFMLGDENYQLLRDLKAVFDPESLLNPGKIVDAAPIDQDLRYEADQETRQFDTVFDFSKEGGILRAAEKCNGSGDCRKLPSTGGVMCPSYHATLNEKDTTRARANALREILTRSNLDNPFSDEMLKEVMDLCISCKGCTGECPSDVDMATLKAEFLYQYQKTHGRSWRSWFFANQGKLNSLAARMPGISNFLLRHPLLSRIPKAFLGVARERPLPKVHSPLKKWAKQNQHLLKVSQPKGTVFFFLDEFTNLLDAGLGQKALRLLTRLGYQVRLMDHAESGRAHISKGFLEDARRLAEQNVVSFAPHVSAQSPLIGLEPSAILSFRDEYPRLVGASLREKAKKVAGHTYLLEEFLQREAEAGRIGPEDFPSKKRHILLHGHCHQKAMGKVSASAFVLSLPDGHSVQTLPSGCCGMAGSFGYEKEHYAISQKIGELVLFPALREAPAEWVIAAPGTSCRHQIEEGVGRKARHPVELLI